MVQSCKSGRAFGIGPGSGLSLSKYFGMISGLHINFFMALGVRIFFFRDVVVLTAVTSVSEVIVIFFN